MRIFDWEITVHKVGSYKVPWVYHSILRRYMAKKVDEVAHKSYHRSYHIARIKAARSFMDCGLKEAKNWVDGAFTEQGHGKVR